MAKETLFRRYALRSTDDADLEYAGDAESSFYGIGDRRDNRITSLEGNDTLNGGVGVDTLVGAEGNDTYIVDEFDKIVELEAGGTDTVWSYVRTGSYSLPENIENLVQKVTVRSGGSLSGNSLNNQITGSSANDTIDGNGGSDTLIGGLGVDTFLVSHGTTTVNDLGNGGYDNFIVEKGAKLIAIATSNWIGSRSVINEGEATIQSKGKLVDLSLLPERNGFKLENIGGSTKLIGSAAEDTIMGGKFSDTLQGFGGSDTISGGLGADTFLVDVGTDKITDLGLGGSDIIQVYLGAKVDAVLATHWVGRGTVNYSDDGSARIFANGKSVNLSSVTTGNGYYIENLSDVGGTNWLLPAVTIWGSAAEDTIIGGKGGDTLFGGRGDDRIIGLGGSDRIDAGPGSDTVVISDGDVSGDSLIGGDGVDTLEVKNTLTLSGNVSGFESVALMADTSTSPPTVTTLTVSPQVLISNSLVSIKGSSDSAATEKFVVALTAGTIDLSKISSVVDATVVVDSSSATVNGTVTAIGTAFGDHFIAGSTNSTTTLPSVPIMVAGYYDGGAGSDTMLGGAGADSFHGGAGADSLSGGEGSDTLSGGVGVDTLLGGGGNDRLILQEVEDSFGDVLNGGTGIDTLFVKGVVDLSESATTVSNIETIAFDKGANLTINFRSSPTTPGFIKKTVSNAPDSGYENTIDTIVGPVAGDHGPSILTIVTDNYDGPTHNYSEDVNLKSLVVSGSVRLVVDAGGGNDTLTGSNGAESVRGGDGDDVILGRLGDDTLYGNEGRDSIDGGHAADTSLGGDGNDVLIGGAAVDTLSGGSGKDTFSFENYTEAPWSIGTIQWTDKDTGTTKDKAGIAVIAANAYGVIDLEVETIVGFNVLDDYLDFPDGGPSPVPTQIAAVKDVTATPISGGIVGEKGAFQTIVTSPLPYYTVSNGVLKVYDDDKLTATSVATNGWALHNWLSLVDRIADSEISIPNSTGGVIVFEYAGDTFVFARDASTTPTSAQDLLIRLTGITGITAFSEQSNGLSTTLAGG